MASAQEPGFWKFYAETPDGTIRPITTISVSVAGPGGSADGAKASTANADNQLYLAPTGMRMKRNSTLLLKTITIATDGVDVSDCHIEIPILTPTGVKFLTRADFTSPTPTDYTSTANVEQTFGGYLVTEEWAQLGGGYLFASLEDDTA